jgi:replicative DNA helicase
VTGVPSGFTDLDQLTSGFQPGDLVIIAARPSMGKTSLVLNIAQNVGRAGGAVGVFSLEMAKQQIFIRMLTSEAGIDGQKFRTGFLSEKDYGKLSHALGALAEMPVYIDDSPAIGVLEMRAKARRLMAATNLRLVVVDYIQLMQGRGRFESRQQEVAAISRSLKGLAKELNIPVLALSQLSRAPESRGEHRPQLSDLRESGALEQDADVVLFIYRPEVYDRDQTKPEDEGLAEIIIGKQRNGPIGSVKLSFLHQYTRFESYSPR